MRIVGGRHRGRRLLAPPGATVRPTSDRAREALFNILSHGRLAADGIPFAEAAVLDAFAGTGALGLEALSRGAADGGVHRTGPRGSRDSCARISMRSARAPAPGSFPATPPARRARYRRCALAFLDPPYRSGLAAPALAALDAAGWFAPEALAVVEIAAREELAPPAGFILLDERVYGAARLVFLRRGETTGDSEMSEQLQIGDVAQRRARAGAGPGDLAHGRGPAPRRRGGGGVAARDRARHDPDRHRRDVRQRRRRGGRRPRRRRAFATASSSSARSIRTTPRAPASSPPASAASKRLATDRIDLYLLHWRGSIPLAETLEGFQRLERDGKIRHHGVSNFDRADMAEWAALQGGDTVAADQVLYNLEPPRPRMGPRAVVPRARGRDHGLYAARTRAACSATRRSPKSPAAATRRRRRSRSPGCCGRTGTIVIPKASRPEHVRENRGALDVALTDEDWPRSTAPSRRPRARAPLGML